MASTFVIACPDCGKKIKVTTDVIGKKIRCKECSGVLVVRKPKEDPPAKSTTKPAPKPEAAAAKPARQSNAQLEDEDDDGKTPYILAKDDSGVPRCPNCVKEMESAEARVCLHCGFDKLTRKRTEVQAVYEHTGEDKFQWRLPGILCAVAVVMLLTLSIICMLMTKQWMKGGWFENDTESREGKIAWYIKPGCFMLFNGILTLVACYHLGRFAYKRLVVNNLPPERVIEKGDNDDDDDDEYEDDDD